jgi:hypothetical protein
MHERDACCLGINLSINGRVDFYVHLAPELAKVVGITAKFGEPTVRPQTKEEDVMKCPIFKKSAMPKKMAATGDPIVGPALRDNEDSTVTVMGVDAANNPIEVSAQDATITVVSSDTSKMSLDAPIGMKFTAHFLAPTPPGQPVVASITQTFASGAIGPFKFDLPADITGTKQAGIVGKWGEAVVRP